MSGAIEGGALAVPIGARVFVVSELLLSLSGAELSDLTDALDAWEGPGALVFAGGLFDAGVLQIASPAEVLAAHPQLRDALVRFACGPGRSIVWLPGDREIRGLDRADAVAELRAAVPGSDVADAIELDMDTAEGRRVVRVEPGEQFDTSLRAGRVGDVRPDGGRAAIVAGPSWLEGADRLPDARTLPRFVLSRLFYRRVLPWSWLLLVPFVLAVFLKLPLSFQVAPRIDQAIGTFEHRLGLLAATTAIDLVLVVALALVVMTWGWKLLVGTPLAPVDVNAIARDEARGYVAAGGTGLVTGSTQRAELRSLATGFYANAGSYGPTVIEHAGLGGLPPVYAVDRVRSWLELEAGAGLHVRLVRGVAPAKGTRLEHLAARRLADPGPPVVVAAFPDDEAWPVDPAPADRGARVRRRAAAVIALTGLVDLVAVATPPLEDRLQWLLRWVPLVVPEAATAAAGVVGIALLLLARGVRRGRRDAWRIAVVLLSATIVLHVLKGADVEEAALTAVVVAYLLRHRRYFVAPADYAERRRRLTTAAVVAPAAVAGAVLTIEAVTAHDGNRMALPRAVAASSERLVALRSIPLSGRLEQFLSPTLFAVGAGVALWLAWLLVRPVTAATGSVADDARARQLVRRWGSGTLDYFALRNDKEYFFSGNSVIAYALHVGVCLVSPDPIGPPWERDVVWEDFRRFADRHGWVVGVLGADQHWLPIYRRSGMRDMYVGDEAVVDLTRFGLDGRQNRGIRQAYHRVANHGYTISFHDPARASTELAASVKRLMRGRRGDLERGFSMTLGRIFDPADEGLLMAVCHAPDGTPVAFCQYVPAPGIGGYSLDLMRRDDGEHPNGLLEFVLVATMLHLAPRGTRRLSLNFATMRAVLAGETDDTVMNRIELWALRRISTSMQIESLWHFNAKFHPEWQPRYVVFDSREHAVSVGLAVARAESFWELPVIGRFLTPAGAGTPDRGPSPATPPVADDQIVSRSS